MTNMKRITISIPDDIDQAVEAFRKTKRFESCSYTEVIRQLIAAGLKASKAAC